MAVREKDNGRLIVTLQGAGNRFRDLGITPQQPGTERHNLRIAHQKFSIHPSSQSATHNQLHFHQIFGDGQKGDQYHVTRAITSNKFAPLFIKRYSALSGPVYDLKRGPNVTNLGKYDVQWFTLILGALVARRDCVFNEKSHDLACLQFKYREFSLVILWCFFILPATDFSMITGFITLRPEDALNDEDRATRERVMAGWTAADAIGNFKALRDGLRDEGIASTQNFVPEAFKANPEATAVAQSRYFRSGEYSNKVIKALKARFPGGI